MFWKINKSKCIGCGDCANVCPEGIKIVNGKAEIKNENVDCMEDAAKVCPNGAISNNSKDKEEYSQENINPNADQNFRQGFGRGMGQGLGRGLGGGPRDGRGRGLGGGGRNRR